MIAKASPAAAETAPLDWFDVKNYGALGNGADDDTPKIQAAIDAAVAAGGGTVYFPAGAYAVTPTAGGPALSIGGNGIRLVGASSKASTLVKKANGILLRMSGAPTDTSGSKHRRYCSMENLGFNGNGKTGLLLELYYNDNSYFRDVFMSSNNDLCIGPHLKVDASCRHVYASNIYAYAGGFASGYSTAQNIIAWAGSAGALENVLIANSPSAATVNSGIDLYSGSGSTAVLRNVVGRYSTKPTGTHIYYEASSTGDFRVENCYANIGGQSGGTVPTKNQPNPPLRMVAGAVSDASFTHTPVDGTLAVDSTNRRLYVRVSGKWLSTALS
ncbi:glycosyl hydrolase family 28-related protein [Nonomuraea sp. NPDC052116]|uniref:glycosyl hydrolase family 28-related protein n=1 Tax=Nonomuraea sp. NPDC052116 TaxID=3155665 RepID=UPI00342B0859